jgi:hypothetical protein
MYNRRESLPIFSLCYPRKKSDILKAGFERGRDGGKGYQMTRGAGVKGGNEYRKVVEGAPELYSPESDHLPVLMYGSASYNDKSWRERERKKERKRKERSRNNT